MKIPNLICALCSGADEAAGASPGGVLHGDTAVARPGDSVRGVPAGHRTVKPAQSCARGGRERAPTRRGDHSESRREHTVSQTLGRGNPHVYCCI